MKMLIATCLDHVSYVGFEVVVNVFIFVVIICHM